MGGNGYNWSGRVRGSCESRVTNQFDFLLPRNEENNGNSIEVRFNDGGHARVSGTARFDLPLDVPHILDLHQTFGSPDAIHDSLIKTVMVKSVYMTGPLLSSKESYSEKRSDLINLIEDQAVNGVFQTEPIQKEVEDVTGAKKWVTTVDMKRDKKTQAILRQEESPLIRFKINLYNISIAKVKYEEIVDKQIATQQQATMDVQIAITNSKKAEQDVQTSEAQGRAAAAKAKWAQEVEKSTEVTRAEKDKAVAETNAQQRLSVADLDRRAAEQQKAKAVLLGEGEATARKLVMEADGALEKKLAAYREVNGFYAQAIANHQGPITPSIVMGDSKGQGNTVSDFMNLIQAKTARDLALDMELPGKKK